MRPQGAVRFGTASSSPSLAWTRHSDSRSVTWALRNGLRWLAQDSNVWNALNRSPWSPRCLDSRLAVYARPTLRFKLYVNFNQVRKAHNVATAPMSVVEQLLPHAKKAGERERVYVERLFAFATNAVVWRDKGHRRVIFRRKDFAIALVDLGWRRCQIEAGCLSFQVHFMYVSCRLPNKPRVPIPCKSRPGDSSPSGMQIDPVRSPREKGCFGSERPHGFEEHLCVGPWSLQNLSIRAGSWVAGA